MRLSATASPLPPYWGSNTGLVPLSLTVGYGSISKRRHVPLRTWYHGYALAATNFAEPPAGGTYALLIVEHAACPM